jgi:hypothetical protein
MNPNRTTLQTFLKSLLPSMALVAVVTLSGCGTPQPTAWTLAITKKVPSSIEVDLIPVSAANKQAWENYPPSQYWQAGDAQRQQATEKKTLYLEQDAPYVLAKTDPIWKDWLNRAAVYVLIMAHLDPNTLKVNPSASKIFLPLTQDAWKSKDGSIQIEVRDTMVQVLTPTGEAR